MTVTAQMLQFRPGAAVGVDLGLLEQCIRACMECEQACTACADACLSESMVAELTACIRKNLDCADMCGTALRVLSREIGTDPTAVAAILQACVAICAACAAECESHGQMHEHCAVCAQVCRRCEEACRTLLVFLSTGTPNPDRGSADRG